MARILDVYFFDRLIGELEQDNYGELTFTYLPEWVDDPTAIAISCSLPLRKETYSRKECRAFFAGILPEDYQRKLIAKNLGISASNDFSMLEKIGGECAGNITFLPEGQPLQAFNHHYRPLKNRELADMIRELHKRPLLAGAQDVRLSLAGVQDKIAVRVENGNISIPLDGAPSTHILKPTNDIFDGIIFNEAFCLELARQINLPVPNVELKKIDDIDYLLIKRYDRLTTNNAINHHQIKRLHQEDFCQALNIVPENKYQSDGGPSLKQCFSLLRDVSSVPAIDIANFTNIVIFNFLIGNCDAHGKNFSLLYHGENQLRLAPFYDLVSTVYYKDLSTRMAMKLGGEYDEKKIGSKNFESFADETGLPKPAIKKRIDELAEATHSAIDTMEINNDTAQEISQLIKTRCESISKRKK